MLRRCISSPFAIAIRRSSIGKNFIPTVSKLPQTTTKKIPGPCRCCFASATPAAAAKNDDLDLATWQKKTWATYLSNGLGSKELFRSIDKDSNESISMEEIRFFLQSVEKRGVHPRAFKMLDELAHDHELDLEEFQSWLVLATKFGGCENDLIFASDYSRSPHRGELGPRKESASSSSYRSLNVTTMSQAVRKMQVRVCVVCLKTQKRKGDE